MQDPSYGVAQALQNHVHLISGHRFAQQPAVGVETAFRYLLDAPTIVKQTAPMAWQYVQAPRHGTVWLEWISPRNGMYPFSSDGYVWGDPESSFSSDFGGYTIEWMTHSMGFRPGLDQMAMHARTRFHFIAKNPGTNAAPPDPSLWIVHYYQTEQSRMLPISQIPITNQMRQLSSERRYLEQQGQIERKDFMLHDREHWPSINLPGSAMQHGGMYGNPMMQQQQQMAAQQRYPQPAYPQGQGPPAKRARHSGPVPATGPDGQSEELEEEKGPEYGDYFDNLNPRDISMARYTQHHKWMEEVFSSPYATSRIVPADLGLGLMGELKGLTDGILDPASADEMLRLAKTNEPPTRAKEAQPFTNLKKEQLDEFNRRVEKHLEDGQAEIERMKKEHAEKMAGWKKSKFLLHAERRLRNATWEGHENAVPVYRLEEPAVNGHAENGVPAETVEDVVKDVERTLGVKIVSYQDATLVQKGGLEREEKSREEATVQGDRVESETDRSGFQSLDPMTSATNGDELTPQPSFDQQQAQPPAMQPSAQASIQQSTYSTQQEQQQHPLPHTEPAPPQLLNQDGMQDTHDFDDMDVGDTSLMDVDGNEFDFIDHDQGDTPDIEDDDHSAALQQSPSGGLFGESGDDVAATQTPGDISEAQQQQPIPAAIAESSNPVPAAVQPIPQPTVIEHEEPAPLPEDTAFPTTTPNNADDLFGDTTFDDLPGIGGDEVDDNDLLDFDGGMGLDDSEFGNALHGMDTPASASGPEGAGSGDGYGGSGVLGESGAEEDS